ncbi:AGAP000507-PA-like protein [Anopheles sinensis]|uniref:AGAP000507-PA-like protein n=1 Tax=Anopheles sinensis TaxID=74873 RepID=A0A084WNP0_ANOSI|nr:AGAP000507-PA-like protein [Anopheles sinensis]
MVEDSGVHQPEHPLGAPVVSSSPSQDAASVKPSALKRMEYKCEFCELVFKRKDSHDRHRYSHTGKLEHPCLKPNCNKAYSNRSHLLRHMRASHFEPSDAEQSTVDCKHATCKMKFTNKQSMERHYQAKHILGKPYACGECDERFWRKLQLKRHKFKHTGQYPHKCEHCGQGYVNMKSMRDHRCTRNMQKCSDCEKEFKWWTELVAHRRLEHPTKHRCSDCSKVFHTKRSLKIHARRHLPDDEREVFECPHEGCPRFYEHRRNLYFHVRAKHEGLKKFVCTEEECGLVLATQQKLDLHMKLHKSATQSARRMKLTTKMASKAKATANETAGVSDSVPEEAADQPLADPNGNKEPDLQPGADIEKHNIESTSESELEAPLHVTNILSANLDSLKKQIDALRADMSIV